MNISNKFKGLGIACSIVATSMLFAACMTTETNEARRSEAQPVAYNKAPHAVMAPLAQYAGLPSTPVTMQPNYDVLDREQYNRINENGFLTVLDNPMSTFSIDVDTASYSNVRRFIDRGQLPPADAVRIEELVNYFDYQYPAPTGNHPFSITTEMGPAPWNKENKLVHIGLKAKVVEEAKLPPANLVFLIDVSGSMGARLPLVKSSMKLLANKMRAKDRVAIVVYAGAAGLVLESTAGDNKQKIYDAIDQLQAGGSTAGGAGIELAYKVAQQHFKQAGNNRVILATDGDFNVGPVSQDDLQAMIEKKRESGVFLTVLGFGMGNYRDALAETLANKGNGNYAYIDSMQEAKKTLVTEFGGTMVTIAKDVKIQVQFNPALVSSYRLIGYENRILKTEDFDNDKKDAGEIGTGHTVTAIYEVVPNKDGQSQGTARYMKQNQQASMVDELMYVKFRYKKPDGDVSQLIEKVVKANDDQSDSLRFKFSAAVAEFGLLLRDSEHKANSNYKQVIELARASKGEDTHGYRSQFINLVETASEIKQVSAR